MTRDIKDGEVAIVLSPEMDENNDWTGVLKTGLVFGAEQHPLAMQAAMDTALTMASVQEVLETYTELMDYFLDARHNLLKAIFPKAYAESLLEVEDDMDYTTEGNIIKLTKWTKTLGEA